MRSTIGAWLSPARALGSGPRGRWFESSRPDKMEYCVYILQSSRTKRYYTGHTEDFERRLGEHNSGKNKSTRNGSPWQLVYQEVLLTRSEAMQKEEQIKNRGAKRFLEVVEKRKIQGVAQLG